MKILGLPVVTMCVAIVVAGTTSYAAPACCDPGKTGGQNGISAAMPQSVMPSGVVPGMSRAFPTPSASQPVAAAPRNAYVQPVQAKRPISNATVPLSSVYGPVGRPAALTGAGCCAGGNGVTVPSTQAVGPGCGAACASCVSGGRVARHQVVSSDRPSAADCCTDRGMNPMPPVQAQFNPSGYSLTKAVYAATKQGPRAATALTANSGAGRSPAPRFGTLW